MEDKKIRVAITHGDTNGIGYEMIFKAFAEPEMLELCTPIIYGSPKAGTPLMQNDPTLALQLPLKVLITENDGKVQVLLNSAEQVVARSNTPYSAVENTLANAEKLIRATVAVQP